MNETMSCPPEILDLLPWYADDGLTGEERGIVEAHAATCAPCRREILDAFRDVPLPAAAPSPERVLARVFETIATGSGAEAASAAPVSGLRDVSAPAPRPAPSVSPRAPRTGPRRALRSRLPAWAAAAAAAFAIGSLGTLAALRLTGAPAAVYETAATAPQSAAPADGPQIEIVLRPEVSVAELSRELRQLRAEIVSGPSEVGRYQLRLPAGADAAATAALLRAEGTGIATFAEPTL